MIQRIALVGASSTGKTTVYELLKNKLPKYEFVNESTRTVGSYGFPINEKGTDATQLAISSFHLEALLQPYNLVLDRCYMDVVVYSRFMDKIKPMTFSYIEDTWNHHHPTKTNIQHSDCSQSQSQLPGMGFPVADDAPCRF